MATSNSNLYRRMKHFALIIAMSVLFGVLTTYGIAWRTALYPPFTPYVEFSMRTDGRLRCPDGRRLESRWFDAYSVNLRQHHAFPEDTVQPPVPGQTPDEWWMLYRGALTDVEPTWTLTDLTNAVRTAEPRNADCYRMSASFLMDCSSVGWPLRAVRLLSINKFSGGISDPMITKSGNILGVSWNIPNDLPIKPIWPGFLINTSLYTLAWLIAIEVLSRAIRKYQCVRRLQRGLCVNCRYDLKGTPVDVPCPECGATHEGSADKMKNAPIARGD